MNSIFKYPRTHHIETSRFQPGDEELKTVPFTQIAGKQLVIEEKLDGANAGISFAANRKLRLQSRGHYLSGGPREKQFDLFKTWANTFSGPLYDLLGERYLMFGEWLFAKHTIFYTDLEHYFLEFDIYDKEQEKFLDTPQRRQMLEPFPFIRSVPVLFQGKLDRKAQLNGLVKQSGYIRSNHLAILKTVCAEKGLNWETVSKQTDPEESIEGMFLKIEENGKVTGRFKWIRPSFYQTVQNTENHWMENPIIPNRLLPGVTLF